MSERCVQEYYPASPLRYSFTDPVTGAVTRQLWDLETENPLQDLDGANAVIVDYVHGLMADEALARVAGGATHAFVTDHIKSVRNVVDLAGNKTNSYRYAAFGDLRLEQEAIANRLRFTAREWFREAGVQYNRNRFLLPGLGRWAQRDPMGMVDGPNMYAYVGSNPVSNVDPAGLACVCVADEVIDRRMSRTTSPVVTTVQYGFKEGCTKKVPGKHGATAVFTYKKWTVITDYVIVYLGHLEETTKTCNSTCFGHCVKTERGYNESRKSTTDQGECWWGPED